MNSVLERRLAEFVDRTEELETFRGILGPSKERIMAVWGDGGMGKSSLVARMVHECRQRGASKAEVVWTETRKHDFLGIMRTVRDEIATDHFNRFTELVNYFTVPHYELTISVEGNVSVAEGAQFEDVQMGDVAGVVIKDLMIPGPRGDLAVPAEERQARLTDRFVECFRTVLQERFSQQPLVLFLDAVEKMSTDTRTWVWVELLGAVCDERLPNLRVVLCGRSEPPADLDRDVRLMLVEADLRPLAANDIQQYLERRGLPASVAEGAAGLLEASTFGNPLSVANAVDVFLRKRARAGG